MAPIIQSIFCDQTDRELLVYKFPGNEITTGSILTVNESQEAFFFRNGTVFDSFTAGRHKLSSANLPILNKLINLPSGGESTFHAEVWFVSKLAKRNVLWGAGGLRVIDPFYEIPIKMGGCGQYGIQIKDGALFLKKLVGTLQTADTDLIFQQFRSDVVECFKVAIATYMKERQIGINELGTELIGIATEAKRLLQLRFDEYGVDLLNLTVDNISFDENDKGYQTVMDGIAEAVKLKKLGVSYMQERQMDIAQTAAGNEGAGNMMGIGMGLGAGSALGQMVGQAVQPMAQAMAQPAAPSPAPLPSFYVAVNGQTTGPFPIEVIAQKILGGEIVTSTYLYKVGGAGWCAANSIPELASHFAGPVPPPPPPPIA